jgi:DNA-binding SARP family transcriptional activator/tetratricopeptide (TPR) repeat protein
MAATLGDASATPSRHGRDAEGLDMKLEWKILGPLEVWIDGRPASLGGRQRRAVLAALLVEADHVVSTDDLVRTIWWRDEEAPGRPTGVLQTHIHQLRRALEPGRARRAAPEVLVSDTTGNRVGYSLRISREQLDETRFSQLVEQGKRALDDGDPNVAARSLREALKLWRGPALADLADWPFAVRYAASLEPQRLAAEEAAIEAGLALGRHSQLLGKLQDLVRDHPAHEGFRLQLALALYRSRRREEAARVCREGLERLQEQGLESAALEYLQRNILQQVPELDWKPEPSTSRPRPSKAPVSPATAQHHVLQLPRHVGDFTGRNKPVADLLRIFERDADEDGERARAPVIAAIAGKPGVGKTALAVHVAHQLRARFPEGALYVDLRGTQAEPMPPSKVLIGFLLALGVPRADIPDDLDAQAALYRARLAGRRTLVLLDNAADEGQVRHLLPGSGGCGVLITSRQRLAGLDATHLVIDVLEPRQAVELLGKVAGRKRVAAEREDAQFIVGLCGYLPLAVRIAGAKLAARRDWRLARLVERLMDERQRLSELEVGDLEVRASLALSYQGRREEEQRAFRLLGLLDASDFPAWVAAALLDVPFPEAERLIDDLVAAQLLETLGEDAAGQLRYRFHDLLRAFARERLRAEEEPATRLAALRRVLGAYIGLAERAAAFLEPGDNPIIDQRSKPPELPRCPASLEAIVQDEQYWFAAERLNVVEMVGQAHEAEFFEMTWLLANAVSQFFDNGSHFNDWQRTHELALQAARRAGHRLAEAATLRNLGKLSHFSGHFDDAKAKFEQSIDIFGAIEHRRGEAYSLRNLGVLHEEQGRFAEAIECLTRSRKIFKEIGSELGEALSLKSLGDAHRGNEDLDAAVACFDACQPMFRRLGNRLGEGSALLGLGIVYGQQGRLDDAAACFQESRTIMQQMGHRRLHAHCLRQLADVDERLGRTDEAIACLDESLQLLETLPDRRLHAATLDRRGVLLEQTGDHAGAWTAWEQALAIFQRLGAPEALDVRERLDRRLALAAKRPPRPRKAGDARRRAG